ncbi:DNA polymerase III subunit alpha [Candidatus Peregrinibacteria bacterium]|nr:DNA polymerase III subunit alpha [Candidatus Peregrinibacteria bacterium]
MSFVHLHVHSYYSLLDGLSSPETLVQCAKKQGSPALALTDHGVLYGAIEFYKAAKKAEIKPIIGSEVYIAGRTRFDKTAGVDIKPYHLTLLATNFIGYQNLINLVTKAHLEGYYYKPRVDYGLLSAHHEGLIALSGCMIGEIARVAVNGDIPAAAKAIAKYQDIFGKENFWLEIQDHPLVENQDRVNKAMIELAQKTGAGLVATNDAHYVNKEDADSHDILICIQTQTTVKDENRMRYTGDYSLRPPEEMKRVFSDVPEAIENTLKIADRCNLEIPLAQNLLPVFNTPNNTKTNKYLAELCEEGMKKKYPKERLAEAKKRLEYELGIVDKMGFNSYFLIVHDFVKFAKDNLIIVGPGRGSAAGSIIAYSLDITEIDPLTHNLLFERFLNPDRISMPDIDIDFSDDRRDEVLNYVTQKYGRENVAQIITFGTMASRAAVRDVGRALGYSYGDVDRIAKMIPPPIQGRNVSLITAMNQESELKKAYETEPDSKKILDYATKLEGTVRHAGTHACAVVMSEKPLIEYTPLQFATGKENEIITQYEMTAIENIGLLKMDFLGLKNLTILRRAVEIVEATKGISVNLKTLPLNDKKTFELLQSGDTTGIFQLESSGMRRYLTELKPTSFNDIVAMISLYRPGPMEWIPIYIRGKHQPDTVKYIHKDLESILRETHGVAIYQEQILEIARQFAGFSLGEADILRKAVGKKITKLLDEQKEKFITGATKKGHSKKFAEEVFEKVIEPFASYGFNKAHATSYAMIAYRTAYMKAHFPTEFMTALLICEQGNTDKIVGEIQQCEGHGIEVLPPSINESDLNFTYISDNKIRFGLLAIKGVGEGSIKEILEVRQKGGKFKSLEDFAKRAPSKMLNKKMIESLAYSGAMDEFDDRKYIAVNFEEISKFAKDYQSSRSQGQIDMFDVLDDNEKPHKPSWNLKKIEPATQLEKYAWEKQYLGLYVSGHPLQGLYKYLAKKVFLIDRLTEKNLNKPIKIGGVVTAVKKAFTKSGSYMLYLDLDDPTGRIGVTVFPRVFDKYGEFLKENMIVILDGKLVSRGTGFQFICEAVQSVSLDSMIENAKSEKLYDPNEKVSRKMKNISYTRDDEENENYDYAQKSKPYIINLAFDAPENILTNIKAVLTRHKGLNPVEIHIKQDGKTKRIKVPFGIDINEEFKQEISSLIK